MKVLDHENIIKFHEAFTTFDYQIYVIEYVKGHDLFKHVVEKEFLEEVEASFIIKKILQALQYLHLVGLVHRDLKPENIMVVVDEKNSKKVKDIKLIDFGFSAYLEDVEKECTPCGTLNYVAPEVYMHQVYNMVTDVFAVGVILYFMVKGELPFNSDIPEILMNQIINGNYSMENDEHFLNVSPACKDLIAKMLETDPKKRITVLEALKHPFIQNVKSLEAYKEKNRSDQFDFNKIGHFNLSNGNQKH